MDIFPRIFIAWYLAVFRGWNSIIMTFPLYGVRKPQSQNLLFFHTLAEGIAQHQGIVQETAGLARHFMNQSPNAQVCFTGFSIGGGMSMYAAGLSLLAGGDGSRMAIVPYAGAVEPACVIEGQMSALVDWPSLQDPMDHPTRSDAERTVIGVLRDCTSLFATGMQAIAKNGKNTIKSIRLVGMTHDHFIPRKYTEEMFLMTRSLGDTKLLNISERWLPGGHILAALVRPFYHTVAIIEAVDALDT